MFLVTRDTRVGQILPNSNYLEQIAALIKQDPSITVRQIASELKFADSKSVYYWLDKENVGGINEFKRLVLGQKPEDLQPYSFELDGVRYYPVQIPLLDWNCRQKKPRKLWHYIHSHPSPRGLFVVRVGTNYYNPWFMQNDLIVISNEDIRSEGSWVLLSQKNQFFIGKVLDKQVICPISLKAYDQDLTHLGIILNQQRYFSS